jgi:predicted nucleic acid-binding protein
VIVLVETNFVLELAFSRDKFVSCRDLIGLAERNEIRLLLPAYSLIEPYEAIIRRQRSRAELYDTVSREIKEITRSFQFEEPALQLAQLSGLLIQVGEVEQDELRKIISDLLKVASIIDLDSAVLQHALTLQADLGLSPQDSVVFASVLSSLAKLGGPACFVTKNRKDFAVPGIVETLERFDCKLLLDFEGALHYVRNRLSNAGPAEAD